jgi:hypothetical protein
MRTADKFHTSTDTVTIVSANGRALDTPIKIPLVVWDAVKISEDSLKIADYILSRIYST